MWWHRREDRLDKEAISFHSGEAPMHDARRQSVDVPEHLARSDGTRCIEQCEDSDRPLAAQKLHDSIERDFQLHAPMLP